MHLPPSLLALLFPLLLPSLSTAAEIKPSNKPCTLHSPSTGSFFDLRPLQVMPSKSSSTSKDSEPESWHARGHDYHANFTINFCGPVVENLQDVAGIPESKWRNVSAFYRTEKDEVFSIGQARAEPMFRGRKLLLNYTNGSPCPDLDNHGRPHFLRPRKILDDDDDDKNDDDDGDDDDNKPVKKPSSPPSNKKPPLRHKTTILSFLCDRDPTLTNHPQISFIGTPDACSYFFEVRSRHACPGVSASNEAGSLGPGGVFGIILAITLLAYLVGGCAYQRTVMHQRGWRQCPNYTVWAGIASFIGVSQLLNTSMAKARGIGAVKLPTSRMD